MNDWKPGDLVLLTDHRGVHCGQVAKLEERGLGLINQRPYWTPRLANGAVASEFEDGLEPAPTSPGVTLPSSALPGLDPSAVAGPVGPGIYLEALAAVGSDRYKKMVLGDWPTEQKP